MGHLFAFILTLPGVIGLIVFATLIYLVIRRFQIEETEDFEDRDN